MENTAAAATPAAAHQTNERAVQVVALDCEFVGIKDNKQRVGRVSIVNEYGDLLYDQYVKAEVPIYDYRTRTSGLRPTHLENGSAFFMTN